MVMLHGLGDSFAGFHWLPAGAQPSVDELPARERARSLLRRLRVVRLRGRHGTRRPARSRDLLFELLDEQTKAGFPTEQTVLGGFSQGSLMTIEVGCRYPHRFSGLVGLSGYVFEPEVLVRNLSPVARAQRFLVTHGYQDPIIPFAAVKQQIELLKNAGLDIAWHELAKAHTIAGEPELQSDSRLHRRRPYRTPETKSKGTGWRVEEPDTVEGPPSGGRRLCED